MRVKVSQKICGAALFVTHDAHVPIILVRRFLNSGSILSVDIDTSDLIFLSFLRRCQWRCLKDRGLGMR
jgi:hypothetical protein